MLTNLSISNYAIIDSVSIDFSDGFSVITGETGAGKSIILGALNMILGERCDAKAFNHTDKKSVIEATFDMSSYDLKDYFTANDFEYDEQSCIIRREIMPNSRSRAFVNDSPVSLSQLKGLALRLLDIHSQHSNSLLGNDQYQLSIIDNLADDIELREKYLATYKEYTSTKANLDNKKMQVAAARADADYNKFLLSQFDNVNLIEGEEEELEAEQLKLSNLSDIKTSLWQISEQLDGENSSVLTSLQSVSNTLKTLSPIYNQVNDLEERIESIVIELKDITSTVCTQNDQLEDNPTELERINERLQLILNLKKKHNVQTVAELLVIQKQLEDKINDIDNGEWEIEQLEKVVCEAHQKLSSLAQELTHIRQATAKSFEQTLRDAAQPLGMANIQCSVQFEQTDFMRTGQDKVTLLISFNKNQPLLPIGNSASGGEISRLMLCVKAIIANKVKLPTVIFDEIDTGVSGEIASKMGEMMSQIASNMQVITITHLPQVASLGDNHYKVYKFDRDNTTITNIKHLDEQERIREIASMLSANNINDAAIANAKSLLSSKIHPTQ